MSLVSRSFWLVVGLGSMLRLALAWSIQTRAWIDEIWVVFDPAYRMLTGIGALERDWTWQVRDWIPPSGIYVWLKLLNGLGIEDGPTVIRSVRLVIALVTCAALAAFARSLVKTFEIRRHDWVVAAVLMFLPDLMHYGSTADLSVLGLPFLLVGLSLHVREEKNDRTNMRTLAASLLLSVSALIRFQYGVIPAVVLGVLASQKKFRKASELAICGVVVLVFDFAINRRMYGNAVLPLLNYFTVNTVGGVASQYGRTPPWFAMELLWRWITVPVLAVGLFTIPRAWRTSRMLTLSSIVFFLLHAIVPHKEYRFFYGAAALLAGMFTAAFLAEIPARARKQNQAVAIFLAAFAIIGLRAASKTDWRAYEIPAKLETRAGVQPDVRGLITYGWGGIYQGCHWMFHKPLPCEFAEKREHLRGKNLNPADFSHVVAGSGEHAPCAKKVAEEGGGALYSCTRSELEALLK